MPVKLFGCALDALDDAPRVMLKKAYMEALGSGHIGSDMPVDPYDVIAPLLMTNLPDLKIGGKFKLPGWLEPRPNEEALPLVNVEQYRDFIDRDEITVFVTRCKEWIQETIFPDTPCMIAVDHAMTSAPLTALSEEIITKRPTPFCSATSAKFAVPSTLLRKAEGTFASIKGTCLYAAA